MLRSDYVHRRMDEDSVSLNFSAHQFFFVFFFQILPKHNFAHMQILLALQWTISVTHLREFVSAAQIRHGIPPALRFIISSPRSGLIKGSSDPQSFLWRRKTSRQVGSEKVPLGFDLSQELLGKKKNNGGDALERRQDC